MAAKAILFFYVGDNCYMKVAQAMLEQGTI